MPLNHWEGLARFLHDGRIALDPDTVERSMRPIALGMKAHRSPQYDAEVR